MRKLTIEELGRISAQEFKTIKKHSVVVVLDNVRSMHNVGAIFRTCDAFLVEKLVLCGITAKPPHREIQKTALGATESVTWEYVEQTASAVVSLQEKGYKLVAVEQTDQSRQLQHFHPNIAEKYAFIFGNEAFGVSDDVVALAEEALEIPQFGTKHSLNIAVSVGIVLWHYAQAVIK